MSFKSAIRANQKAVLQLTSPELEKILPILREIRDDTAKGLHKFLKAEDETYTMHRHRALILQLDKTIKLAEQELPGAARRQLKSDGRVAGKKSLERLKDMVEAGERRFHGAVTTLRLPIAKVLIKAESTLSNRHERSAERYSGRVGQRIRHDMALGVVRGESTGDIAKRLLRGDYKRLQGKPAAMADKIAEKQFFRNQADAERLIRSEMNNAYNATQVEGLREANTDDPGWYKKWDATIDRRTCVDCYWQDGEIVPYDQPFKSGVMWPPLHPNDRCSVVPWRREWPRQL